MSARDGNDDVMGTFIREKLRSLLLLMSKNVKKMPCMELLINLSHAVNRTTVPFPQKESDSFRRILMAFNALMTAIDASNANTTPFETNEQMERVIEYYLIENVTRFGMKNGQILTCRSCGKMIDPFTDDNQCSACNDQFKKRVLTNALMDKFTGIARECRYEMMGMIKTHANRNKIGRVKNSSDFGKQDLIDAILIEFINLMLEANGIDDHVTIDDLDG